MIEKIRAEMTEILKDREGAGRADLLLLINPANGRDLAKEMGQEAAPDRAAGIAIQYTHDVEREEFQIIWREEVNE